MCGRCAGDVRNATLAALCTRLAELSRDRERVVTRRAHRAREASRRASAASFILSAVLPIGRCDARADE
jgi:hypothetical protein